MAVDLRKIVPGEVRPLHPCSDLDAAVSEPLDGPSALPACPKRECSALLNGALAQQPQMGCPSHELLVLGVHRAETFLQGPHEPDWALASCQPPPWSAAVSPDMIPTNFLLVPG